MDVVQNIAQWKAPVFLIKEYIFKQSACSNV